MFKKANSKRSIIEYGILNNQSLWVVVKSILMLAVLKNCGY